MKVDELVEKLNELKSLRAEKENDGIFIYSKQSTGYDFFFSLAYKTKSLAEVGFDWDCLNSVEPTDLHKALNLVDCFLHTPIDERFPKNMYRLVAMRYVEGPIAIKQYVTSLQASGDYVTFDFGSKENAMKWTDKELRNLSQWFPQEAVDAMKEPVEDD